MLIGNLKKSNKNRAFTLAEVLITLAIIGVVAAITIPTLMSYNRKSVVETRLKAFYSDFNQAIKLSEIDNGNKEGWDDLGTTTSDVLNWYNKYLASYLKTVDIDSATDSSHLILYFSNGSALRFNNNGWSFAPEAKNINLNNDYFGTKLFSFAFWPGVNNASMIHHYKKGLEPYKWGWDGTRSDLKSNASYGCSESGSTIRAYCSALIQINGWKIPDDYPLNF